MNIERAIKILEEMRDRGVSNIILAAWGGQSFDFEESDYDWEVLAEKANHFVDWSETHDMIAAFIKEELNS
jgi:hypothetical protein